MKTPHKHAKLIKAWADGEKIEYRYPHLESWRDASTPSWDKDIEYRIKKEPVADVIVTRKVYYNVVTKAVTVRVHEHWEHSNVQFTFDGELGILKKVVMI